MCCRLFYCKIEDTVNPSRESEDRSSSKGNSGSIEDSNQHQIRTIRLYTDHLTSQGLPLSQQELNEDYESSKVGKSKKAQYDADVMAVQDLDRWG